MLFGWRKDMARRDLVRKDEAHRPWRLSAKLLFASSVATVIGFSAICANVMIDMRHGEETVARRTLENLASSIDADVCRNVELYDLSLRNVTNNLVMPELKSVSKEIRHLILFDHAATAKHFGAIQVFDAEGRRIASPRMLLDNFSPMTGAASPNRFGVVDGGKDQHGCAARGGVGGDRALPDGETGGEGADPRCAVRDDGLASQACGARAPAT
jgi:hypothetical protein